MLKKNFYGSKRGKRPLRFAFKICMVAAFCVLGAFAVSAQPRSILAPNPGQAAPALTVYQQEFNYGYLEGKKYRDRHDQSGYENMLNNYYYFWSLYPENSEFYHGRIDGLNAGWRGNVIDP